MNIHATDTKAASTGFAPALSSDRATTYAMDAIRSSWGLCRVGDRTQLFSRLDDHKRLGRFRVLPREPMPFATTIHNDGFLYCWEPI